MSTGSHEACQAFKKSVECGTNRAFKHLAQIALLSNGDALSYNEGLYYLCCAKKLGVKNIEEMFEQYSERFENYSQTLEEAELSASELKFEEFENEKFVIEDTHMSDRFRLVGGFPKWS